MNEKRYELLSSTAKLIFSGNEVTKIFKTPNLAMKEFEILQKINNVFGETNCDGWTYRMVKPLKYKNNDTRYTMEVATGEHMDKYIRVNPQITFHAGRWLALYHQGFYNEIPGGKVVLFGDFKPAHLIIDNRIKEVVAIDPGVSYGKTDYPEVDIIYFIFAIVISNIRCASINEIKRIIIYFLKGYLETTNFKIKKERLMKNAKIRIKKYNDIHKISEFNVKNLAKKIYLIVQAGYFLGMVIYVLKNVNVYKTLV